MPSLVAATWAQATRRIGPAASSRSTAHRSARRGTDSRATLGSILSYSSGAPRVAASCPRNPAYSSGDHVERAMDSTSASLALPVPERQSLYWCDKSRRGGRSRPHRREEATEEELPLRGQAERRFPRLLGGDLLSPRAHQRARPRGASGGTALYRAPNAPGGRTSPSSGTNTSWSRMSRLTVPRIPIGAHSPGNDTPGASLGTWR